MRIGQIIEHVLGKDHPAVLAKTHADGDTVPVLVTGVDKDGNATGTAFHADGSTSVVAIPASEPTSQTPETAPQTAPETAPQTAPPADSNGVQP